MDDAERLRRATRQAQQEDDLPDDLAQRLFALADRLQGSSHRPDEVDDLIEQVTLYDTYAQTGYLGMGVSGPVLEQAVARMEQRLKGESRCPEAAPGGRLPCDD